MGVAHDAYLVQITIDSCILARTSSSNERVGFTLWLTTIFPECERSGFVVRCSARPDETRLSEERVKELVEEPVEVDESGNMGPDLHWDNGDIHYVYVCVKVSTPTWRRLSTISLDVKAVGRTEGGR